VVNAALVVTVPQGESGLKIVLAAISVLDHGPTVAREDPLSAAAEISDLANLERDANLPHRCRS